MARIKKAGVVNVLARNIESGAADYDGKIGKVGVAGKDVSALFGAKRRACDLTVVRGDDFSRE